MRAVLFLAEAVRDVYDAFRWYEHQRAGLGLEFLLALDAAVERIRLSPEGHEIVARRTRKGTPSPLPVPGPLRSR